MKGVSLSNRNEEGVGPENEQDSNFKMIFPREREWRRAETKEEREVVRRYVCSGLG